jgi:ubiquinone/menaquinone biosynthesis C-methylase UbiE
MFSRRVFRSIGHIMVEKTQRYDRVAAQYHRYRPRYPEALISHLAKTVGEVTGADVVVDVGSGTGIFSRQLRAAFSDEVTIIGIEPSPSMRAQAIAETGDTAGLVFADGVAEQLPFAAESARAVVAATAAHWFERPAFYAEAHRILVPGGTLAVVEYVRNGIGSPIAAALISFMERYGSQRAYMPPDYRRELAEAAEFGACAEFVLSHELRLDLDAFIGLALSSSHAAGVIERFGMDGARSAVRELAMPYRVDDEHVLFGYLFQCFTVRREA